MDVAGIILAGGASRRMQAGAVPIDKALLPLAGRRTSAAWADAAPALVRCAARMGRIWFRKCRKKRSAA